MDDLKGAIKEILLITGFILLCVAVFFFSVFGGLKFWDSLEKSELEPIVNYPNTSYIIKDSYYKIYVNYGMLTIKCFAMVENTGDTNLYLGTGEFDIEDENGHLLETIEFVSPHVQVIAPGEIGVYYSSTYFEKGDPQKQYNLIPKLDIKKATVPLIRYKLSDLSLTESYYGSVELLGKVQNTLDEPESLCYVSVICWDDLGNVIYADSSLILDDVMPGEWESFEVRVGVDSISQISEYKVYAYPFQYQFN